MKFTRSFEIENVYNSNSDLKGSIKEEFSILDLGFNDPRDFIYLSYRLPISEYIGIDKVDSNSFGIYVDTPYDMRIPEELFDSSVEDKIPYNKYLKFHKYHGVGNLISKSEFDNTYRFYFETDALEYLNKLSTTKVFSLIVISNLLHLLDKGKGYKIFNKSFDHLKVGGLIYLKVYVENDSREFDKHISPI